MHISHLIFGLFFAGVVEHCAAVPAQLQNPLQALEQTTSSKSIRQKLVRASIVPDILPEEFQPVFAISLWYPYSSASVSYGNEIPVDAAQTAPSFIIAPIADAKTDVLTRIIAGNKTYTLVLSDPDATSRADPVKGQMCHWILTGISLGKSEIIKVENELVFAVDAPSDSVVSKDLIDYLAPGPPPKTGRHRYVFVLLESTGRRIKPRKPKDRPRWGYEKQGSGVMEWAEENGLAPVGANFFYAQNVKQ